MWQKLTSGSHQPKGLFPILREGSGKKLRNGDVSESVPEEVRH